MQKKVKSKSEMDDAAQDATIWFAYEVLYGNALKYLVPPELIQSFDHSLDNYVRAHDAKKH